jgi:hypothetical protein
MYHAPLCEHFLTHETTMPMIRADGDFCPHRFPLVCVFVDEWLASVPPYNEALACMPIVALVVPPPYAVGRIYGNGNVLFDRNK